MTRQRNWPNSGQLLLSPLRTSLIKEDWSTRQESWQTPIFIPIQGEYTLIRLPFSLFLGWCIFIFRARSSVQSWLVNFLQSYFNVKMNWVDLVILISLVSFDSHGLPLDCYSPTLTMYSLIPNEHYALTKMKPRELVLTALPRIKCVTTVDSLCMSVQLAEARPISH